MKRVLRTIDSAKPSLKKKPVLAMAKKVVKQPRIVPMLDITPRLVHEPKFATQKPRLFEVPQVTSPAFAAPRATFSVRKNFTRAFQLTALALVLMTIFVPAVSAFEAHIVGVTATIKTITPPTISPAGSTGIATGTVTTLTMDDAADANALNIYYKYATGTVDSTVVPDPVCGQSGPNGGGGVKPLNNVISFNTSSVVKAIACHGAAPGVGQSAVNTQVYSYGTQVNALVINEFLPNASTTPAGNQGIAGGHTTGRGGEWVELYNNSNATTSVAGYILTDGFVPITVNSTTTWTTDTDFTGGVFTHTQISGTGISASVIISANNPDNGTYEKVLDLGINQLGHWQNLSATTTQDHSSNSVCFAVATSADGITYTSYTNLSPCANSSNLSRTLSLSSIPDSRFIKWMSTQIRQNGTKVANLDSISISYTLNSASTYHELPITATDTVPSNLNIPPHGFLVVYRDGDSDFELNTPTAISNAVKLFNGHPASGATLIDTHSYTGPTVLNKSYARIPDGSTNWVDPCPTPGEPNTDSQICDDSQIITPLDSSTTDAPAVDSLIDQLAPTDPIPPADVTPLDTSSLMEQATTTDTSIIDASSTPLDSSNLTGQAPLTDATTSPSGIGEQSTPSASQDSTGQAYATDPTSTPPDSISTSTDATTLPDASSTPADVPPADVPADPPADSSSDPAKQEAILPPQPDSTPAIAPAPISTGGDTPPPEGIDSAVPADAGATN